MGCSLSSCDFKRKNSPETKSVGSRNDCLGSIPNTGSTMVGAVSDGVGKVPRRKSFHPWFMPTEREETWRSPKAKLLVSVSAKGRNVVVSDTHFTKPQRGMRWSSWRLPEQWVITERKHGTKNHREDSSSSVLQKKKTKAGTSDSKQCLEIKDVRIVFFPYHSAAT